VTGTAQWQQEAALRAGRGKLQKIWYKTLRLVFGLAAFGFGLAAAAVIYEQVTLWLKTAVWVPRTIGDHLIQSEMGYPILQNWLGVQKIIDQVLSWPASVGYFLVAWIGRRLGVGAS
jgi:hypothetical protein